MVPPLTILGISINSDRVLGQKRLLLGALTSLLYLELWPCVAMSITYIWKPVSATKKKVFITPNFELSFSKSDLTF